MKKKATLVSILRNIFHQIDVAVKVSKAENCILPIRVGGSAAR
ncbi:hypothetical protein [Capnocytophaga canimorsus]|nr:hypothetical protein [Capnocytophaga canimorsus]